MSLRSRSTKRTLILTLLIIEDHASMCIQLYPAHFKGHSNGHIVRFYTYSSFFYLWVPAKSCTIGLPRWDLNLPPKIATLSSQPNLPSKSLKCSQCKHPNKCNVMVVTGMSTPAFVFHRLYTGEREWTTENSTLEDPYAPNQVMQFTNAIEFDGRFYALSLQGSLVVIEDMDLSFKITGVSADRAVPSKGSRQYREFLAEVDSEILLFFLISRKSINLVDDAEVFRLDVVKLLFVKVERLGGRTLFLEDEFCTWVDAREVGCKKNCIYFTHDRVDEWWVFDMENGSIVPISSDEKWSEPIVMDGLVTTENLL